MITREQAGVLIDYMEAMSERSNHQRVMQYLNEEVGLSEKELDAACRVIGQIAGRDFSIL